jgi:hypothetical protein
VENAVEQSRAWNEIFGGKTPVIPYGGLDVPTERGTFHIEQGTGIGPARNGRGYRFNYGAGSGNPSYGSKAREPLERAERIRRILQGIAGGRSKYGSYASKIVSSL